MDTKTLTSVIQFATLPSQKVICSELADLPNVVMDAGLISPLLIIISPNIYFRNVIKWFEKKSLFGRKFIITRSAKQNDNLFYLLLEERTDSIPLELMETNFKSNICLRDLLETLYDWIIFTSEDGERYFFEQLAKENINVKAIGKTRIAVLGEKTAQRLQDSHLISDFLPCSCNSDCFLDDFISTFDLHNSKGHRAKGNFVDDPILDKFCKVCGKLDVVEVYNNGKRDIDAKECNY